MDLVYLLYGEKYVISSINFSEKNGMLDSCMLNNEGYLNEKSVIEGFSKLTQITENDSKSLLNGDLHISQIPQLQHTVTPFIHFHPYHYYYYYILLLNVLILIILLLSNKVLIEDYYCYSLQNGIVIFGLNSTHALIKEISGNNVKITFNELMCKNISTESRAKRRKKEIQTPEEVCEVEVGSKKFIVKLPKSLLNLEVVELNTRLENEPELITTEVIIAYLVFFIYSYTIALRNC
ncbi:uncharacterized protein TA18595 [Theileria annulata]|uniref:Uncharacterized protein n=1 Tax=Theileria annulata TaxID=5874 RepID=Q4UBG9_THEAN|nr:uncharacterized protein TA18595 [Theileria annulata]CAI75832.1 hypothetical protein TA18595 [Theileria annulata]|eukprot:XP_955308.1 hypothetical protein TA18595 [Theileria annulata]